MLWSGSGTWAVLSGLEAKQRRACLVFGWERMASRFYTVAKKTAWNHPEWSLPKGYFILIEDTAMFFFSPITTNSHSEPFQLIFFFRWEESITTFSHHSSINKCAILEMVEYLPECLKVRLYWASDVTCS